MNAATVSIYALLAVAALAVFLSALALLLVRNIYEQLHFPGAAVIIGGGALLAAIFIHTGWSAASAKGVLLVIVLFLSNAVLAHATARAARIRQMGHFDSDPARNPGQVGREVKARKDGRL